jgi:hypothetical protein
MTDARIRSQARQENAITLIALALVMVLTTIVVIQRSSVDLALTPFGSDKACAESCAESSSFESRWPWQYTTHRPTHYWLTPGPNGRRAQPSSEVVT